MKESHGEGLATHTGPESCGASREGGVEALTGVRAGQDIEPRKFAYSGKPTLSCYAEGNNRCTDKARCTGGPRGHRPCARSETPRSGAGRSHVFPRQNNIRGRIGKSKDAGR
jgi:hypothetical protein